MTGIGRSYACLARSEAGLSGSIISDTRISTNSSGAVASSDLPGVEVSPGVPSWRTKTSPTEVLFRAAARDAISARIR